MEKKLLFCLLLIFCNADMLKGQAFGGGFSLGLNASQIDGDAVSGFNNAGLSAGVFINYEIGDKIYLQPELLFEQLGSAANGIVFVRTSHISLPVVLKINIPIDLGNEERAIQFHAGPVVGLLVRARNDIGDDLSTFLKDFDTRLVGGFSYRVGPGFSFMLRYGYSLGSIVPNNVNTAVTLLAPGKTGLAHNYVNLSLRLHLTAN